MDAKRGFDRRSRRSIEDRQQIDVGECELVADEKPLLVPPRSAAATCAAKSGGAARPVCCPCARAASGGRRFRARRRRPPRISPARRAPGRRNRRPSRINCVSSGPTRVRPFARCQAKRTVRCRRRNMPVLHRSRGSRPTHSRAAPANSPLGCRGVCISAPVSASAQSRRARRMLPPGPASSQRVPPPVEEPRAGRA